MDILQSDLFSPWTDPKWCHHYFDCRSRPSSRGFYFVNDCMTPMAAHLWFYCAFPPSGVAAQGRTLAVLDLQQGELRHFPETQFSRASPYVDVETGQVYWASAEAIWTRGPQPGDHAERVNALPEELIGHRQIERLATHLTRSSDGKEFFVDAAFGLQWVFGSLPVDGGDFQLWHRFDRNHTHAQFSPTDPDLVLFCQEFHNDPVTGLRMRIEDRLWLMRRGEAPRPVLPQPTVLIMNGGMPTASMSGVSRTKPVPGASTLCQEVETWIGGRVPGTRTITAAASIWWPMLTSNSIAVAPLLRPS